MNLLLDTHILLWWATDDPDLPPRCRDLLLDREHVVHYSSLSIWEVAIKHAKGHLPVPADLLHEESTRAGLIELPFTGTHAARVGKLPPLHPDPFDRGLIAQALETPLVLVSQDEKIHRYPLRVLHF